jgi:hypothetical protein
MSNYNFRQYHYRSMNAASDEERAAINQELKDLYASLPDDEKEVFNTELQTFLAKEMGRLKSSYESIKGVDGEREN